ncbi:MAG TPA: pyrroloquinoline quinone biosynthesis protein PqqB [Nitrospira sp.]|nr:pyrroloquinoline quinone biosynthesis protein PqqB [Nitrospira sp.]
MRVRVLGSAAGGGFPQWNCGCPNCDGLRNGTVRALPRTEASLAIQAGDGTWFLIHATPDVRSQLARLPDLQPRTERDFRIAGILLTNADLDQCLGLFCLRESQPLHLYATESVRRALTDGNPFYEALERMPGQVTWHEVKLEAEQPLFGQGTSPSLLVTPIAVPGKPPLYRRTDPALATPDVNVALLIRDPLDGRVLGHAPCVGRRSASVDRVLEEADCLFFDGTFWSEDELPALGIGTRSASDMAHWPVGGPNGSLAVLSQARASRKFLIHVNNTNPLLRDDSLPRRLAEAAGVEMAWDGMEVRV